jgi:hypothetical protein
MQAIFARRQLEHGDSLSQRTFRVRHTTQLRSFGADELLRPDAGDVAFFSETEEAPALEIVTGGTCDMVESDNRHGSLCITPTDDALCYRSCISSWPMSRQPD